MITDDLKRLLGKAKLSERAMNVHKRGCRSRIFLVIKVIGDYEYSKCEKCGRIFRNPWLREV